MIDIFRTYFKRRLARSKEEGTFKSHESLAAKDLLEQINRIEKDEEEPARKRELLKNILCTQMKYRMVPKEEFENRMRKVQ